MQYGQGREKQRLLWKLIKVQLKDNALNANGRRYFQIPNSICIMSFCYSLKSHTKYYNVQSNFVL